MAQQQKQPGKPHVVRLPLLGALSNRGYDSSKDQRFVNIFPESTNVKQLDNTKYWLNKRPGLTLYRDYGTGEGRQAMYFNNKFYIALGNTVYEDAVSPVAKITLTGSTGPVGMLVGNSSTLGDYLFVCDGTSGWIINTSGTVTAITDPDFPTPHVPTPTFIDGYICLPKGSDVYNCVVDDPTAWDGTNFLTAEMFPDPIVALARQNNQVVVFGTSSIEFFYDAANASGSPLSRNDSTTIQMGTAAPYCIYQNEKFCAYISQSDSGGRAVWIVEGFQPKKVSDEYIERILDAETDMSDCRGFGFRTKGHMFYLINLKTLNRTLVYDTDEKLWHEWSSNSNGSNVVFSCDHMVDNQSGAAYVLHSSNGILYKLDVDNTQDDGTNILVSLTTNKYDMDTYNRKFMHGCRIVGDSYSNNSIDLQWTDDDYQTWSNVKTISLTDNYPAFQRMGAFRRRAFKLSHAAAQPLRLESLEVVYTEGAT